MTLAAEAPDPVLEGVEKERVAPFSGIVVRDHEGNERGGLGYLGGPSGRVLWALDHPSFDAVGTVVAEDGTVSFLMNQAPSASAKEGQVECATRLRLNVAPDGTPEVSLADADDRPRLRLSLRPDGAGAIEFLNAAGDVVHAIVPEHD